MEIILPTLVLILAILCFVYREWWKLACREAQDHRETIANLLKKENRQDDVEGVK